MASPTERHRTEDLASDARRRRSGGAFDWVRTLFKARSAPPTSLRQVPQDPWPGDAEAGALLLAGRLRAAGELITADPEDWSPDAASLPSLEVLNGFDWLRDLRAFGGDQARRHARALVSGWVEAASDRIPTVQSPPGVLARHDEVAIWASWAPHVTGTRIAAWIGQHDFYCATADEAFRRAVFASLDRQAWHLHKLVTQRGGAVRPLTDRSAMRDGWPVLAVAKGLAYAGIALPDGERLLETALKLLDFAIARQIPPHGLHATRAPQIHLRVLRDLIDVRTALRQVRIEVPEPLQSAIERMTVVLRTLRHADGALALFHGGGEDVPVLIDTVLAQSDARARSVRPVQPTGYERVLSGRTLLIVDVGSLPPPGLDTDAHAGLSSFEMSVGRERLIVNCGSLQGAVGPLRRMLAATAAHSTLTLGDRNLAEVDPAGGIGRRPEAVTSTREEEDGAVLVTVTHDGYGPAFGTRHQRRLYVAAGGEDVRGEDTLDGPGDHAFAIRFHLHPGVQAVLTQDGSTALLRLPSGAGWRLRAAGGTLELEESLYAGGSGEPRRTSQVVLIGRTTAGTTVAKWALRRERRGP